MLEFLKLKKKKRFKFNPDFDLIFNTIIKLLNVQTFHHTFALNLY